jgi:hypothetical protein
MGVSYQVAWRLIVGGDLALVRRAEHPERIGSLDASVRARAGNWHLIRRLLDMLATKIEADRAGRAIGVRVPNLSCKRRYRHLATAAVVSDADYILPPDLGRHAGMRRIDAG